MGYIKLLLALALVVPADASTGSLGIVSSESVIRLNGATVPSNGAVFEGSTIEPGVSLARLQLNDGSSILLSPGSRGRFYTGHMELEKGEISLRSRNQYRVDTRGYRVSVSGGNSQQAISLSGATLKVNSIHGDASVRTAANLLVGSVLPGQPLSFSKAADDGSRVTGPVRWASGIATLEDETTHVQFQLSGTAALAEARLTSRYSGRVAVVGMAGALSDSVNILVAQRVTLLASNMAAPQALGQSPTRLLSIVVEDGEGAINNIRERTARETIVRVEDENHRPVANAAVLFSMPGSGPGGTFADGSKLLKVVTDSSGRARALIKPNSTAGKFQVSVSATANGVTAAAVIAEVNVAAILGATGAAAAGAATAGTATTSLAVVSGVAVAAIAGPVAAIVVNANSTAPTLSNGVPIP